MEAIKTSDYKDYRVEKPSPLGCLISLLVKTETRTQTMSGADEFEKNAVSKEIVAPQIRAICQNCVLG